MCSLDTGEWIGLNTEWTALLISRASTNKPENVPLVSLSAPSLIRGDEGSTCHSRPWYHDVSNLFTLVSHFSSGYVTSLLHQGPSIPQRYSCVKGAFSLRLPVAGVKGIQILKTKWDFCCQDSKSATPYSREHQVPDMCQHLKHGLSAKNPVTISRDRWLVSRLGEVLCSWTNWLGVWRLRAALAATLRLYS